MSQDSAAPRGLGRRLARNSLHSASGRVVGILAWLAVTPALVKGLGPEGFGVWSLFYALTGWLGAMDLGFSQVALRFGAAARARDAGPEAGEYASLATLGYLVLGVLWLLVVLVAREPALDLLRITGPAREQAALAFLVGAPVFLFSGLANTTIAALQAWDRFDLANAVTVSASLTQLAALLFALSQRAVFEACLGAVLLGWAVAWLVGLVLLATGAPGFRWSGPRAALARLPSAIRFGGPLQLANGVAVMHQQLGKALLVRSVSLASVGPYELGLRVSTAASTFAQLVLAAMIPEASVLHARADAERLRELHSRAGRLVTAATAAVTAALVAAAPALFAAWLGAPDPSASLALRGLALAAYAAIAGGVSGAIARGVGRTSMELEWSAWALVLHAGLGVWLVPRLGLAGALVAIVAANTAAAMWFATRLAATQGWPVGRMLWEPFVLPALAIAVGVLAGDIATGAMAPSWPALFIAAGVGSLACAAALVATHYVPWHEIEQLFDRGTAA
jgi:O-antigen/teichoic acid export membrane protein